MITFKQFITEAEFTVTRNGPKLIYSGGGLTNSAIVDVSMTSKGNSYSISDVKGKPELTISVLEDAIKDWSRVNHIALPSTSKGKKIAEALVAKHGGKWSAQSASKGRTLITYYPEK